jgi:hypothetical protein
MRQQISSNGARCARDSIVRLHGKTFHTVHSQCLEFDTKKPFLRLICSHTSGRSAPALEQSAGGGGGCTPLSQRATALWPHSMSAWRPCARLRGNVWLYATSFERSAYTDANQLPTALSGSPYGAYVEKISRCRRDTNVGVRPAPPDACITSKTVSGGKNTPMPCGVLLFNHRFAPRIQPARVYSTSSNVWWKYSAPSAYA